MTIDSKKKAVAVGHIPSGLFIICAHDNETGQTDGFLGSWVQQISFDPLMISLCIKPGRPAADHILKGRRFSINVVGEHDRTYLKHFWSGYDPEKNPFAEIDHRLEDQLVYLSGAKSIITCELSQELKPGDHHLVIAKVIDSFVNEEQAKPMVHIRKSGLDY
jgi:flavin reductase (DIM6/NTAB) family NADH-FMN oxidoreductase RutF